MDDQRKKIDRNDRSEFCKRSSDQTIIFHIMFLMNVTKETRQRVQETQRVDIFRFAHRVRVTGFIVLSNVRFFLHLEGEKLKKVNSFIQKYTLVHSLYV